MRLSVLTKVAHIARLLQASVSSFMCAAVLVIEARVSGGRKASPPRRNGTPEVPAYAHSGAQKGNRLYSPYMMRYVRACSIGQAAT